MSLNNHIAKQDFFLRFILDFFKYLRKFVVINARFNDIHPNAIIPKSCYFDHCGLNVVIHANVRFGERCIIEHNVTIGARIKGCFVVVGDDCWIGAGTVILGELKIGNNVNIGANSVILKSVPDNTTVVGVWK